MKIIFSLIVSGALVVSGFGQTRNVLVGTNNAVVQPTNFWSADASNARSGLGLGSAATNPATAFQPSSASLANLAANNGGALTNLAATSIVGIIPSSNISTVSFTNIGGTLAIASGGTGATNAANARQNLGSTTVGDALFIATNAAVARTNLGLGWPALTNTDATNFRTAIGLGATNTVTFSNVVILGNVSTTNVISTATNFNVGGTLNVTNKAETRTNLGLGATWLTNTNVTNFRTAIGLGATNNVSIGEDGGSLTTDDLNAGNVNVSFAVTFTTNTAAAATRTNLGLGLPALTNTSVTNFRSAIGLGETNSVTFSALTLSSDLNFGGGDNIVLSTTNGTKIGTATNQLLGFYNQTPIVQPSTTGVTTSGFTQGSGNNVHPNSTFTGGIGTNAYTISDIVAHLKSLGLIAP
jgi:hypothetical protein